MPAQHARGWFERPAWAQSNTGLTACQATWRNTPSHGGVSPASRPPGGHVRSLPRPMTDPRRYAQQTTNAPAAKPKPEPQPKEEEAVLLPEIVVTGRSDSQVGIADSASQGNVGQEQLELRPIIRPGEILETVPGLIVSQHSGDGKANQYYLRGFNLDHGTDFATSVDGMPVNLRSHAHGQGYTDLGFLIPELVRTVGYQKGSTTPRTATSPARARRTSNTSTRLPADRQVTGGSFNYYRGLFASIAPNRRRESAVRARRQLQRRPVGAPRRFQEGATASCATVEGDARSGWSATLMGYKAGGTRPTRSPSARWTPARSTGSVRSIRPTAATASVTASPANGTGRATPAPRR